MGDDVLGLAEVFPLEGGQRREAETGFIVVTHYLYYLQGKGEEEISWKCRGDLMVDGGWAELLMYFYIQND